MADPTSLPTPDALAPILDEALSVAREAATLLLEGFRHGPSVRTKDGRSDLVTEYDLRSEALIRAGLARALPDHAVVGEEQGGEAQGYTWFVDPIDGTTNFAHGHPFFCLSMGLTLGSELLVGIVIAPALGLEWTAIRGGGAHRSGTRCAVSACGEIGDALLCTGFPARRASVSDNNYRSFLSLDAQSHGVRRCGAAALELALVADGAYDAFWDLGLKPWDLAAGALLVREAGGIVTDMEGAPLSLSRGRILASNSNLHASMVEALGGALPLPPIAGSTSGGSHVAGLQGPEEVG